MHEIISAYRRALGCYSKDAFDRFFELAGIDDPQLRELGRDFLGIASAFYLAEMDDQAGRISRTETLKHLSRAKKASRALADNLSRAMVNDTVHGVLLETALDGREELRSTHGEDSDTYAILNAIFPLEGDGKGFRVEGFQNALGFLADRLAAIEDDSIAKRSKGRIHAMRPWAILMVFYWHEAKGERPRIGHYQNRIGDYDSPAVAALSHALERIDPEVSSRSIVDALKQAETTLAHDPTEATVLLTFGLGPVVLAGEAVSTRETLAQFLGMPPALMDTLWASHEESEPVESREHALVAKEEFFETLKSSEGGKILLRTLMEIGRR